jgi:hypothetical protein
MRQVLEDTITKHVEEIKKVVNQGARARDARQVLETEKALLEIGRKLSGELMGLILTGIVEDESWQEPVTKLFKAGGPRRLRDGGYKEVTVKTLGGTEVTLRTKYLAPKKYKHLGMRRRMLKRGRQGTGLYPVLVSLGITHGCTPALLSEIPRQVVASGSGDEARDNLDRLGVSMDIKTVWRIGQTFARDCMKLRDQRFASASEDSGPSKMKDQRVVVCVDGGRVRTREPRCKGRIPEGKKRRRFDTPWKEPKLLIIYRIDAEGKRDPSFAPIIDGTLGEADEVFALVVGYLRLVGAKDASELIVLGDGARWIWIRLQTLIEGVGIDPKRVTAIVDFYHAVEHLQKIADLKTGWGEPQRKRWVTQQRSLLRRGNMPDVIASIKSLCQGRHAKSIQTELNFFSKNISHMKYAWFKRRRLPLGSGAVESSIRRVVNLRMKGPCIFWLKENAEGFLHLRCLFKSGRWDDSFMQTLDFQAMRKAA